MASDSSEPASAAHHTAPRVQPVRSKASASKSPGGPDQVGRDVKARPIRRWQGAARNIQGSSPWARQPENGKQTGKNDQNGINSRQRPGGGLVQRRRPPSLSEGFDDHQHHRHQQQHHRRFVEPANHMAALALPLASLRSSTPQAWW